MALILSVVTMKAKFAGYVKLTKKVQAFHSGNAFSLVANDLFNNNLLLLLKREKIMILLYYQIE